MLDFSPSDTTRWYYAKDGHAIGPLPMSSIRALVAAGQLELETLVTSEGTEEWRPLSEMMQVELPAAPQTNTIAPTSEAEKWYERPLVVFVSMLLCFPFGLAFLWKSRHFSHLMRIGWTAAVAMLFAASLISDRSRSHSVESADSEAAETVIRKPADTSRPVEPKGEPIEYKIACIDAGHAVSKSAPELKEYKRLLAELGTRFEITPNRVAEMVHALVKNLREDEQIETTRLEMLLAAEKATTGANATMFGKGDQGLSSAFAALATLMIDGK